MSRDRSVEMEKGTTSRRRFIRIAGAVGAAGLAGCGGNQGGGGGSGSGGSGGGGSGDGSGSGGGGSGGSGGGNSIQTRFWEEWPVDTKGVDVNDQAVQFEYTVVEGEAIPEVTVQFAQSETPWMREHALMIQQSFNDIGVPVNLKNVQPSTRYGEFWRADIGHPVPATMNLHGPDPQRGLDPNPFLMRAHPETGGNYYNYKNDEVTELLDEQATTIGDREARAEICQEIQRKLSEDAYIIASNFPEVITVANTANWEGYVPTPGNGTTRDSFIWTQVNLQPTGDSATWVKGVTSGMQGTNLPWSSGGQEEKRLLNVYDGLFDASPQLEIVPGLATNADVVDDTTVEMDLREGVTWHDGESFTPEDVKFSVEMYKQHTAPQQGPFYRPIESVEVLSSNGGGRVRFNLTQPDAAFLTQRAVRSAIIPQHRWSDVDSPSEYNPDNPVGTGPFSFVNWEQGSELRLEKHADHWLWDDETRREIMGEQYFVPGDGIDGLVEVNVGNVSTLIGAMQAGDIDAIGTTVSNQQAERAANASGVEKQTARNYVPTDVHINHIVPLFRDKTFRVALSHAVDKQGFVESTLGGRGEAIQGQNLLTPLLTPFYGETEPYAYDVEQARTMLQQAGYTFNGDDMLVSPQGDAWGAFEERVEDGHATRSELDQADFS
ncbi:ABC transporter substrate-binding protein [Salinigranum rubrum]|uniref:ABC transporter substrate-binding protein n=1 Tax=Salinigranum rubrum TaxID=755307 RepID=A0A2I8VG25_9EURY|nr:ABC transporter substrate-binding protein [Salinigranum rubrum]AUV80868.1 ABC transporter substrate-binding protein [Salinigranum rubrum]